MLTEKQILDALQAQTGGSFELTRTVTFDPTQRVVYQGSLAEVVQGAGIIQVQDIAAVDMALLLQEVIGAEAGFYNLRNVGRVINMNELKASIPLYTKAGAAHEKVPELVEATIMSGDWTTVDFDLWKNVAHCVISGEARKKASIDVWGIQKGDAAESLALSENSQIAAELETASEVAGTDWGNSSNSPYVDIGGIQNTLRSNGYRGPYFVAANPLVWADFFGNTFVRGANAGVVLPDLSKPGSFAIPGIPGVSGFSDGGLTATKAVVGQIGPSLVHGNGPTEAEEYRNAPANYDAYILRQWLQPQLVATGSIRVLTGVHA